VLTIPCLSGPIGVYALTHVSSGQSYVGAPRSLVVRFFTHQALLVNGTHSNQALQADWNTYGPDAFTCTVRDYIEDTRDLFTAGSVSSETIRKDIEAQKGT
jgi:hypothetical protein